MKKPTYLKTGLVALLLLLSMQLFAQNHVKFDSIFNRTIKGDMLLIGNNNIGRYRTKAFNDVDGWRDANNETKDNVNVDIDGDPTTFNSSSADLIFPPKVNCSQVVYAGLYWSSVVAGDDPIEHVKFKTPGGTYIELTGEEIWYQNDGRWGHSDAFFYYKDVTNLITALANPEGTYTVANISSRTGAKKNSEGYSAGWSLFVVYEDPEDTSKYITSYHGLTKISSDVNKDFNITGFKTIPDGPVRAKYAFSTLEGDQPYIRDYLLINGDTIFSKNAAGKVIRPSNNFFNSSVSTVAYDPSNNSATPETFNARNPNSLNTLGFDAGIIPIDNDNNSIIGNGDTSATISLKSKQDLYYFYFNAFSVEIIAPKIVLTKIVEDKLGVDIGGQLVDLGDQLYYTIGFQNTGNDDATNLTIRDVLPSNIIFNYPTDLGVLPAGVSVQSYDPETQEIVFKIDNDVVERFDPVTEIRFMVTVVASCSLLNNACDNTVDNQAFAAYQGTIDPNFTITDDPSLSSNTGCYLVPKATNFLADLSACTFREEVVLCGASTVLTAGNGYDAYSWSRNPSGSPVEGTGQSLAVTETGTYYVHNTAVAPCQSIDQVFDVITYGANLPNPLVPFADQVVECSNDGEDLAYIFLCGASDSVNIITGITDFTSITWEKLVEGSCSPVKDDKCANEDASCKWNIIQTGPDFLADSAGQYRLIINYTGGCHNDFYFNVYENIFEPTSTHEDIICTTPGEIVIGNVPADYEYSIDGTNYQSSNVFAITTPNLYTVYIRQLNISPNPCVFEVPDIQVRERNFTVTSILTNPLCSDGKGSVVLAANDVRAQYFYSISDEFGTSINSVGPIGDNNYTFDNLNPGRYSVNVSTEDGCTFSDTVDIEAPDVLTATAGITKPLTCTDGEFTIVAVGGRSPYSYYVNGTPTFHNLPVVTGISTGGTYNIRVVDYNNCDFETSIEIVAIPQPDFTVASTDILCANPGNDGVINVNVTNANGNSLEYSIDNGATFANAPIFTGLSAGNYDVVVRYTFGTDVCLMPSEQVTITTVDAITGTVDVTTPYTCTSDGTITVSGVSGGTAPYGYSLDGLTFQASQTFGNLTNGTYTVTIADANNCTFPTAAVTIEALDPPTDLAFSHTALTCPTNVSTVTITPTGGVEPLKYKIVFPAIPGAVFQTSNIFAGLAPDTYTFIVIDANNCEIKRTHTIKKLPPVAVNSVLTDDLDCTASPDAVITVTISSGVAPFTYALSFNGSAYVPRGATGSTLIYTTATVGTYQFEVTDANGCTDVTKVETVTAIVPPEITSIIPTHILCNGVDTGALDININNTVGVAPFAISVINTTTGTNYGTQTTGLAAGDYTVRLTDSKSCYVEMNATITTPNAITVTSSSIDIQCVDDGTGSGYSITKGSVIVDQVTGGTAPYNYYVTSTNGYSKSEFNNTGTTSTTFDVVDFGLYEINVVDANGCSVLVPNVRVASPPDYLDMTITTVADCILKGTAIVKVGSKLPSINDYYFAIYTGTIPPPPPGGGWIAEDAIGSRTATFTGLTPGVTYYFIIYDTGTHCTYYQEADIPIPTNSTLTSNALASNNITCKGSADGNVSFDINSVYGTGVDVSYEIYNDMTFTSTLITGTGTVPAGSTLNVSNLGPLPYGSYYVLIEETSGPNVGCGIVTTSFSITESIIDLGVSASVTNNANCNVDGVISAIAQNGTAPYEYILLPTTATVPIAGDPSWASANTFNAVAGNYFVYVKDANGCIKVSLQVDLIEDPTPVITAALNNQCTVTEGNFEINVTLTTAGVFPYSYSVDGGAFQARTAPFTISNLPSGTHTIEIQDFNGCSFEESVVIYAPLDLTPEVDLNPTCNDDDGVIKITPSGGSGTNTYTISPSPASISFNLVDNAFEGVPSGAYTVTIEDTITLCTESTTIVVPEAIPLTFTTTPTAVTCFGDTSGTFEININTSGYTGDYTYQVIDNALPPNSIVGVVSANTATNPEIVSGIPAGKFTVVVTESDSPNCSTTSSVIINSPIEALTIAATETSDVTCDNNKGTITAIANGGWGAAYEYKLEGAATVPYGPNGMFSGLSAGSYDVYTRDAGGCEVFETVLLEVPIPISATVTATPSVLACFGDTNASINVTAVTEGQGSNYFYVLNMISPNMITSGPQASPNFNNLGIGTYTVDIYDGYNCTYNSGNIIITQPAPITVDLVKLTSQTCLTNSEVVLSASGGTGAYTYSDTSNFATTLGTFTTSETIQVSPGTYTYYVRDVNGCLANVSNEIKIDPLPPLTIDLEEVNVTINCSGANTGSIKAIAKGGLGNYTYTLQYVGGAAISPTPTQNSPGVFTELFAGSYEVQVDSGIDCETTTLAIVISEPAIPLTADFTGVTDVTCNGANNGILEIIASGGTGVIKYAISPRLDQFFESPIFTDLGPGTYQAIAQDEAGCFEYEDIVIVAEPDVVQLSVVPGSIVPEICYSDLDGSFSVDIIGGNPPYSVSLDDVNGTYTAGGLTQTQFPFTDLSGGDHIVYVLDSTGCESEWNITFPESPLLDPVAVVEYGCTSNLSTNTVTVTVDSTISNLSDITYSLDGSGYQASNIFVDIPAGIGHYVDVMHVNSCTKRTELFDVAQVDPLELVLVDGGLNEIVAAVSGGSGGYDYMLNDESYGSTSSFIIYESGDYTVTVTDSNGCVTMATRFFEYIDVCIPNYFTPNGDGVLDEWGPGCTTNYEDLEYDVFDRYGRSVGTYGMGEKWDGRYNGKPLPTGDYWYVLKLNDPKDDREFVGHFTLYR